MPYVLTVDQIDSRSQPDLVESALTDLSDVPTVLPFTRTVGDEFQAVLDDPLSVVDATLRLMRNGSWHIGVGVGPVEEPLPDDPRRARGPAFIAAREAVEAAKGQPQHLRVVSAPATVAAADAETAALLLGVLRDKRSDRGWEAVDLMESTGSQAEVADQLGVSRQAVGQRLQAANWTVEAEAIPMLARLLERSELDAVAASKGAAQAAGSRRANGTPQAADGAKHANGTSYANGAKRINGTTKAHGTTPINGTSRAGAGKSSDGGTRRVGALVGRAAGPAGPESAE